MNSRIGILLIALYVLGCSPKNAVVYEPEVVDLDTFTIGSLPDPLVFKGSEKKTMELVHTKLDLRFDWIKTTVSGTAHITLKPYRHAVKEFDIDARGFQINSIELKNLAGKLPFTHEYDGTTIHIVPEKELPPSENVFIQLDYIATPDSLKEQGGTAILSDKGLYFIKHDTTNPRSWQLWTQGETEANSAWFPTIDAPNQKMTQEILLTVDTMYKTLSNGILLFSNDNNDGTRTDFWKMDLAHAPYLSMIAVGDFNIVKDSWNDIEVSYYMEPEYTAYARDIFGLTPEMLSFYSDYLSYPYPWSKYSQIAVKDFVSGAMENTTAVIHGDFILQTPREMLDKDYEDYIAHELFHHWFGDLVTTESWANLALNESFATYGEYLWIEHKYGREAADYHHYNDMRSYFREAGNSPKRIIRYDYPFNDAMFDAHSYQKGGLVLHMLRKYVGEDMFREGLNAYLNKYAFKTVEMADFRQVMEEVTGEDLTWFFDQWFFRKGHPKLSFSWEYSEENKQLIMKAEQSQDYEKIGLFILPIDIDIYLNDTIIRKSYRLNSAKEEFRMELSEHPKLVNLDPEKQLICEKAESKSFTEWAYLYDHGPLFMDRFEASTQIIASEDSLRLNYFKKGFSDDFWKIRQAYIYGVARLDKTSKDFFKNDLMRLAQNDENSRVRSAAIDILSDYYEDPGLEGVYVTAMEDSSYEVMSNALFALFSVNKDAGLKAAKKMEEIDNGSITYSIANLYAEWGDASHQSFYEMAATRLNGFEKFSFLNSYADYLERQNDSIALRGIEVVTEMIRKESFTWIRIAGVSLMKSMEIKFRERLELADQKIEKAEEGSMDERLYVRMKDSAQRVLNKIDASYESLLQSESDPKVRKMLSKE